MPRLIPVDSEAQLQPGTTYQIHLEPSNAVARGLMRVLPGGLYAALLKYFSDLGTVTVLEKRWDAQNGVLVLRLEVTGKSGLSAQAAPVLVVGGVVAGVLSIFGLWGIVATLRGFYREAAETVPNIGAYMWVGLGLAGFVALFVGAERLSKALGEYE